MLTARGGPLQDILPDGDSMVHLFSPTDGMRDQRVAEAETLPWTGADGWEMGGALTCPLYPVEGERCPLSLLIHGGAARELFEGIFGQSPDLIWVARDTFEGWSPTPFAENGTTPLLITHGARGLRVPIIQAEHYSRTLKTMGRTTEHL